MPTLRDSPADRTEAGRGCPESESTRSEAKRERSQATNKLALFSIFLVSVSLWAADIIPLKVKTGRWETTVTTSSTPPMPQRAIDALPPDQRVVIQERYRATLPHSTTQNDCITEVDLRKIFGDQPNSCSRTIVSSSATVQKIRLECSTGRTRSSGTMTVKAVNSETIKGEVHMTIKGAGVYQGHEETYSNTTFTSKWRGPACEQN